MAPHPLCNKFPLQSATMAVAILSIVGSSTIMFVGFIYLYIALQVYSSLGGIDDETTKLWLIVFSSVLVFSGGISGLLSCMLYKGAKTKNKLKCQIWLIIAIMGSLMAISRAPNYPSSFPATLIGFIFKWYCLWIVWAFIQEIKMEQGTGKGCVTEP